MKSVHSGAGVEEQVLFVLLLFLFLDFFLKRSLTDYELVVSRYKFLPVEQPSN